MRASLPACAAHRRYGAGRGGRDRLGWWRGAGGDRLRRRHGAGHGGRDRPRRRRPRATPDGRRPRRRRTPFDLAREPAFRATLVRAADDDHVLVLGMHHIVSDGWSLDLIVRDLTELYRARTEGRVAHLPELPLDYADYALWQRESDQSAALDHWRSRLAGLTPLDLPTDHPAPTRPADAEPPTPSPCRPRSPTGSPRWAGVSVRPRT
ncbi:condensation domain-containing protein [Streptomyces diastatochromogenes]|nr:condensation domain-containing protein [Streptomyces diastatochromogenes]